VKLSWNGNYYSSSHKPRNEVLKDLAYQRTRLSQDLEAKRLDREIVSAQAYLGVAQAQVGEANTRVATAQQRVVVAQLQQRQAEENRDFLDLREFGAQRWYDLARQAERIKQRYLDMATELAFLTERAYNAETGRQLHVVQHDYQHTASGNLMGADQLLVDIDYLTFDHVTTTKTKKLPSRRRSAWPTPTRCSSRA
jgi:Tc toxin complex TcA C-terminal TcB-binding domain